MEVGRCKVMVRRILVQFSFKTLYFREFWGVEYGRGALLIARIINMEGKLTIKGHLTGT